MRPARIGGAGTVVTVALAALAAAAGCGGGDARSSTSAPTIVRVVAGSGPAREVATGWVAGDGRVMTVAHALDGARTARVTEPGGGSARPARVIARSARLDVAVLAVDGLRGPALRSSSGRAGQPATLWVLRDGRPRRLPATVRRAITARVRAQPGDAAQLRPGLELSVPIAGGDSGAPLLDADGRLLGVAFARADADDGVAYAVSGAAASGLLR
jgi:S1-C subfamily serine protease